eukprot:1830044-Pleurochrysis_carterae.AAC.1
MPTGTSADAGRVGGGRRGVGGAGGPVLPGRHGCASRRRRAGRVRAASPPGRSSGRGRGQQRSVPPTPVPGGDGALPAAP